jgi:hypothetical protein
MKEKKTSGACGIHGIEGEFINNFSPKNLKER